MSRPRIFISHSSKEPVGREFRDELVRSLRAAHYPVLLDEDIDLNQDWRSTLNAWIGGCDAAVLLLSEAALKSSYVAYEASLLAYRHTSEQEGFKLIPVFIPPVTAELIEQSPLRPACVAEKQAIRQDVPRDVAIQRVIAYLDKHVPSPMSPAQRHARRLSALLKHVAPVDLEQAAIEAAVDLGPWTPGLDLPMKVALHLMAAGLERAPKGVRVFRQQLPAPAGLDEAVTLIATSWVDCRSAAEIPAVAKRHGLLALNGDSTRTAWLYVVGSCPIRPSDAWRVAEVDGVVGDEGLEELKGLVRTALAQTLKVSPATPEEVQAAIRVYTDEGEPVFVALPLRGLNLAAIQQLRTEFPEVTFFFLTGSDIPDEELARQAGIELLQPMLEPGREQPFWELFKRKSKYLKAS